MKLNGITSLILLSVAALSVNKCLADETSKFAGKVNDNPKATQNYWTAERFKNAKPYPLPLVDPNKIKLTPIDDSSKESVFSVDGAEPQLKIKLEPTQLYYGHKKTFTSEKPNLKDRGTEKLDFTSSRLVPLAADLVYPYRAVGKLFFSEGSSDFVCSASVIANRLVLTAGHCVHSGTSNGYFTNFVFVPAYRDGSAPFEKWTWSYVETTPAWISGGGEVPNAGDFAILEMKDNMVAGAETPIGNVTGKLGFATNKLAKNHLHLLGYPCNFDDCEKMHQVTAQNGPKESPNNVTYGSDMEGGSSGGPWVQNFGITSEGQSGGLNPGRNQVVAVTSWGFTDPALMAQGASNFNSAFKKLYKNLCAHKSGNC